MGKKVFGIPARFEIGLLVITLLQLVGTAIKASVNQQLEELRSALHQRAQNILWHDIPKKKVLATHDLVNAALAILAADGEPAQAEHLLNIAFSVQDMREQSRGYGTFPWYYNSNAVHDENANEFVAQALTPIWLHYRDKFSADFQSEIFNRMRAVLRALYRQQVAIGYTNIYLRRAVSEILMGESLDLPGAVHAGGEALLQWLNHTEASGIHEYDSPTYYAVDLNSLVMGYVYAKPLWLHQAFKTALDLFWTDIKANYFPGRQDLSGAHSRDYDFETGQGGIPYYLWTEGKCSWYRTNSNLVEMEQVYVVENGISHTGYHPDWDALPGSSDSLPKWVAQTNDTIANAEWNSLLADARAGQISVTENNGILQSQAQISGPEGGFLQIVRSLSNRATFTRVRGGN